MAYELSDMHKRVVDTILTGSSIPSWDELQDEIAEARDVVEVERVVEKIVEVEIPGPERIVYSAPPDKDALVLSGREMIDTGVFNADIGKVEVFQWDTPHPDVPVPLGDGYVENTLHLKAFNHAVRRRYPVQFVGPTGSGKTTLPMEYCARTQRPLLRVSCNEETTVQTIWGQTGLKDGATRFDPGPMTKALTQGHFILIDEVDRLESGPLYTLFPVTEGQKVFLNPVSGETVNVHPDFRVIFTANTAGRGDVDALYQGAMVQSVAHLDRIGTFIEVGYLSEEQKGVALVAKGVAPDVSAKLAEYATTAERSFLNGDVVTPTTLRGLYRIGQLVKDGFGYVEAFDLVVRNRASEEDGETLWVLFDHKFGEKEEL